MTRVIAFRGECTKNGAIKVAPTIQSFVRKEAVGVYVVYHNLNKLNYSVSVSLANQPGSFNISDQNKVSFKLETFLDRVPTDFDFSYSLCIIGE